VTHLLFVFSHRLSKPILFIYVIELRRLGYRREKAAEKALYSFK
jgi:hypothetical protein